jgi:hypothetical protein
LILVIFHRIHLFQRCVEISYFNEICQERILLIRGHKILLDANLAKLYGVSTKVLNQAVRRNKDRFPDEFICQLSKDENDSLRSQSVTSKRRGGRRYLPYAFTEQGVAMLSTALNSTGRFWFDLGGRFVH